MVVPPGSAASSSEHLLPAEAKHRVAELGTVDNISGPGVTAGYANPEPVRRGGAIRWPQPRTPWQALRVISSAIAWQHRVPYPRGDGELAKVLAR